MKNMTETWELPHYEKVEFRGRNSKYCVCIPIINEGEKIRKQLQRMSELSQRIDILLLDGGSTDGSTEAKFLKSIGIRTLLIKRDAGKLSTQLRMGFAYALTEGYEGIITIDGNNKDSVESIPEFIQKLDEGFDFVQGSRFIPGGKAENTPFVRFLAIKLIHAPFISLLARFRYTDTTNGFRAHSKTYLLDDRVKPFRSVFETYELLAYLSVRAPQLGYKVTEIPVTRSYPKSQKIPTKISPVRGNLLLISILWRLALGKFNPNR